MNGYAGVSRIEAEASSSRLPDKLSEKFCRDTLHIRDLAGNEFFVEKLLSHDYVEANIAGMALCSLFVSLAGERPDILRLVDGQREQIQGQVTSFGKHKAPWVTETLALEDRVRTLYRE